MREINRREFLGYVPGLWAAVVFPHLLHSPQPKENLPQELTTVLRQEFGNYESIVSFENMIAMLPAMNIVAIGDSCSDARDIKTAGTIIEALRYKRKLAIATERFCSDQQNVLITAHIATSGVDKLAAVLSLFQTDAYRAVWDAQTKTGSKVTREDQRAFEDLIRGVVLGGIPVIGISKPFEGTQQERAMNDRARVAHWVDIITQFREVNPEMKDYLIITIGEERSMGADNFPKQARERNLGTICSIGQRTIDTSSQSFLLIESLARKYSMHDLIIKNPQRVGRNAFTPGNGFWIAVHPVDF